MSVLPAGVLRACSADRDVVCYAVRSDRFKLRTISFSRASLRRLLEDPTRPVKIEYLQRDLLASAGRRTDFRYPRLVRFSAPSLRRPLALSVAMAGV